MNLRLDLARRLRSIADGLAPVDRLDHLPEFGEVGEGVRHWYVCHVLPNRDLLRAEVEGDVVRAGLLDQQVAPFAATIVDAGLDPHDLATAIALAVGAQLSATYGPFARGALAYLAPDAPPSWGEACH